MVLIGVRNGDIEGNNLVFDNADLSGTFLQDDCPAVPECDPDAKFRTIDGSCNNLNNPKFGMSFTPVQRVLPNAYADGMFLPRVAQDGGPLPSGREVTNKVLFHNDVPDDEFTSMLVGFGQFLDHDLDHVPFQRGNKE